MKLKHLLTALFLSVVTFVSAQEYCLTSAIGYGGSTTGGGSASPKIVSTVSDLKSALNSSSSSVILVKGTLTFSSLLKVQATNKTIIGLPGATLVNNANSSTITSKEEAGASTGILYFQEGSSNIIIRNLTFKGTGAWDCEGNDGLCIDAGTNFWIDHCDFQDGIDGNFDMKGNTDNISVTWCKFSYLKSPTAAASWAKDGGTADHRFSDLIGSSASDQPSSRKITFAYCWWGNGCVERMPRSRHSQFHLLNCYWSSSDAKVCLGFGDCSAYIEGCYFTQKTSVIYKDYSGDDGGSNKLTFVNSYTSNGSLPSNISTVTKPSYTYNALSYSEAQSAVSNSTCGAGATLTTDESGNVSSACSGPTLTLSSDSSTVSQSVVTNTAITNITYTIGGTATGATVSGLPSGVDYNVSSSTLTISGTPKNNGKYTYTITTTQSSGNAATTTGIIDVEDAPTLALTSGSSSTSAIQGASITPIVYMWGGGATGAIVTGLPSGFSSSTNATAKTITISGSSNTVTTATTFTVTTIGGGGLAKSVTGSIEVTADPSAPTLSLTSGSLTQAVTTGSAITPIVLTWGGGATDVTVSSLPNNLSSIKNGSTITITGTPEASGNFTVTTVGGTQSAVSLSVSITVGSSITESFDDESTTSSSSKETDVTLSSGIWEAYKSKITTDFNNTTEGTESYRLNYSSGYIITPSLAGSQTFTFYARDKKSTANLNVYVSTDNGLTWSSSAILSTTLSSTFTLESIVLNYTGSVKLKIMNETSSKGSTDYDLAIDDVTFTPALTSTSTSNSLIDSNNFIWNVTSDNVSLSGIDVSSMSVYSVTGELLGKSNSNTIYTNSLGKGLFLAVAQTTSGKIITHKFIKK